MLAFATIEESVDVLLSHEIVFFDVFGGMLAIDGFIEFGTTIFPELIAVNGSENVRDVGGEGGYLLLLLLSSKAFFTEHNDYYYNIYTILSYCQIKRIASSY